MSKAFASLALLLSLYSLAAFVLYRAADHTYAVTITREGNAFVSQQKDDVVEVDFGYITSITVSNRSGVAIDFAMDGGPNGAKCRVSFTPPNGTRCETAVIPIPDGGAATFQMTAKSLARFEYSWFPSGSGVYPRFNSYYLAAESGRNPTRIDPDLEIEREWGMLMDYLAVGGAILAAVGWWLTRRRSASK